ncbi:MAG TPA: hypothetical protein VJ506_00355 [Candidatus Limnocylindrales bacterium]|nr:hypothetical protein [Candidatus Limnocylindrales bacterium]
MFSAGLSGRVEPGARGRPELVALALLGFAAAITAFLLLPPILRSQVGDVRGFTGQEAVDLFTPLVTMPLLVLAFELTGRLGTRARLVLVVLIAVWVSGQAIHLATNALGDLFDSGSPRDAFYATDVGKLDHWFDEVLSHWLWHVAWVGLLALLLWVGIRGRGTEVRPMPGAVGLGAAAGVLHGFTWFVVTDEGGTYLLAIPAAAAFLVIGWLTRRLDPDRVIATFLVVGALVSIVLYVIWIALHGWEPASICETLKIC